MFALLDLGFNCKSNSNRATYFHCSWQLFLSGPFQVLNWYLCLCRVLHIKVDTSVIKKTCWLLKSDVDVWKVTDSIEPAAALCLPSMFAKWLCLFILNLTDSLPLFSIYSKYLYYNFVILIVSHFTIHRRVHSYCC